MKEKIIKISVCSFLAGVFLRAFVDLPFGFVIMCLSFSFFCMLAVHKKFLYPFFFFVVLAFVCLGFLRHDFAIPKVDQFSVHFYQDENSFSKFRGMIADNPDRRETKTNYTVEVDGILIDGVWKNVSGRVLFSGNPYPEYKYGDYVELTGFLLEPPEFDTFSYKNYLSLFKIYSVMYYPRIYLVDRGKGSAFFSVLFGVKSDFEERLNSLFPEPAASFASALLIGAKRGIPEDIRENFSLTGLSHIVAISGYHISLIIFMLTSLLGKFPRRVKMCFIIVVLILFALFTGASAGVLRASIMGVLSVLAVWFGRQSQITNALFLTAFAMVFYNPSILLFDVGFQLSFLATFGLVVTGEKLKKYFSFLPGHFGFREIFAMTFSAQVFALPVILANFKRLSLVSPLANVLVVPVIPFAMLFGFVSVVLSYFNFTFGFVFMLPAWLVLQYCVEITQILAKLPWASYEVPWFSHNLIFAYFLIFILFAYFVYPYSGNLFSRA